MKIPHGTYRLQLNKNFKFTDAEKVIRYLSKLGISDFYFSPILKAQKGSMHGYDVVNPNEINPELGTIEEFSELAESIKKANMGVIVDIVPNHMAYSGENPILIDILENGEFSQYYTFYDVDWEHPFESINGKILAPFLGKFYGECLENKELTLEYDTFGFSINYYNLRFYLRIESYLKILTYKLYRLRRKLGKDHPDYIKYLGVMYIIKTLPLMTEEDTDRYDQIKFIKRVLWELFSDSEAIKLFIDQNIKSFNGIEGNPESFDLLDDLLSEQNFRLTYWKVATDEINYRRFFNVNSLISVRVEDDPVFNMTHDLILELFIEGKINGLRIDHIDGLYNPTAYLQKLKSRTNGGYIVVEKILEIHEQFPETWDADGTTGYDYLNFLNGLFIKKVHKKNFDKIYYQFTGIETDYEELLYDKKRLMLNRHMSGDIDNIARMIKSISGRDRFASDYTFSGLKMALEEIIVLFPVYRTYVTDNELTETDKKTIKDTITKAKALNPTLLYELRFIEKILLLDYFDYITEEEKIEWRHFVMRFQQFTGPLMAKGLEDTVFYIYNKFISLNEVGGNPGVFGISINYFHEFNNHRFHKLPHSLNALSTHDIKRGEDIRARLNVLSEIPRDWERIIKRWSKLNNNHRKAFGNSKYPDKNDEYFLYQIMLATFPFDESRYDTFIERIEEYLIKAVREAKIHSNWLLPDEEYEEAYKNFFRKICNFDENDVFFKEFLTFHKKISYYGVFNSLSQTMLKILSPGVPDFYQGTELWDLLLVDPDNRGAVDFELREKYLDRIMEEEKKDIKKLITRLFETVETGEIKLFLIHRLLKARKEMKSLFNYGKYTPIKVEGKFKDNVVAFAREYNGHYGIVIATRFLTSIVSEKNMPLGNVYENTKILIPKNLRKEAVDIITDNELLLVEKVNVSEILTDFPVAFLKL